MARRKLRTEKFGRRGYRVTLTERSTSSNLYLRWWSSKADNWRKRSLGHSDWDRGIEEARQLSDSLRAHGEAERMQTVTIAYLFSKYERLRIPTKGARRQREDRARLDTWQWFFGSDQPVNEITNPDLDRYVQMRAAGEVCPPGRELSEDPSARTIQADVQLVRAVFRWGQESGVIDSNPVAYYRLPKRVRKELQTPERKVATYDDYLTLLEHSDSIDPQQLFRPFLGLLEALGWRVSAVCAIRASDLDLGRRETSPFGRIRKRAESDKEGVGQTVPLSEDARAAIDLLMQRRPVAGDSPLFPAPRSEGCWSRHHAAKLLRRTFESAGMDPERWRGFHALRRKWATERKHLPRRDVAEAGGWKSPRTLDIYQSADEETMLEVVSSPRKLRGRTG